MNQISGMADRELNALSRRIGKADAQIEEATKEKNESWNQVLNYMDEVGNPKFIADDGFTLQKQYRQGSPKLDSQLLHDLLVTEMGVARAGRLWARITDSIVNSLKLEEAVKDGKIPPHILDKVISTPEPTFARVRREWSKEDAQRAEIFGVKRQ